MGHHADCHHYSEVIMDTMASQITSLMIVYSTIYSGADQRKHQSSMSLAFVRGIHRWRVNSPHKGPVTWKMFPFGDVIMIALLEGLKVGSQTTFNTNRKKPCRRSIKTQLWVTRMESRSKTCQMYWALFQYKDSHLRYRDSHHKDIKNNAWVTVNNDFLSRVRRFGNDFHEWRSHEWKSLPNRLTSDKKDHYSR